MVDIRTRHANEILKQLENTLSDSIIKRGIRLDIKVSEASWAQKCTAPLKAREKIDKKSREKLSNIFIII